MHLTNTSVNRKSPMLGQDKGPVGMGSKWTFRQLKLYLADRGINYKRLFSEIEQIITLTLLTLSAECLI